MSLYDELKGNKTETSAPASSLYNELKSGSSKTSTSISPLFNELLGRQSQPSTIPEVVQKSALPKRNLLEKTAIGVYKGVNYIGDKVSDIIPGVRAAVDSIIEKSPDTYKKFAKDYFNKFDYRKLAKKTEDGKWTVDEDQLNNTITLALGFTGGGEGAAAKGSKAAKAAEEKAAQMAEKKLATETSEALPKRLEQPVPERLPTTEPSLQNKALPESQPVPAATAERPLETNLPESLPKSTSQASKKSIPSTVDEFSPDISTYIKEEIKKQEAARTAGEPTGIFSKAKDIYKEVKRKIVDFTAPIEDTLRIAQKKGGVSILPEGHITNQIDRVLRSPTLAGQFVKDKGLATIIKEAPDLGILDQYMIAKHAIDVDTRGINTGRNIAMDNKLVRELAPQYESIAARVNQYARDLLNYSVEAGVISKQLAENLKKMYPNYVPLKRVFSEIEKTSFPAAGGKGVASLSTQTIVQKLKGSDRAVEGPIGSLLEKTLDVFKQGEKNKAGRMIASYEKLPGNPFQLRELKPGERATHTISFFENGEKRVFETTKEIAEAAKALNVQQLNILGRILALPVRLAKVGITGINLPFIASNVVKDQVSAIINSKNALKTSIANPAVFFKSLLEAVGHGKLYDEMARNGALGTSFDIARDQIFPTIKKIRAGKSVASNIKYTVTHPGELLRAVENIVSRSEEFTRIQQYAGTKEAMIKKGMFVGDATIEASRAARENTVNFARRGEWGQVLNSAFLYLNAGIQGSRTFVRNFSQRPIATSVKLATVVFTPIAAATAWNLSDPERKKAYEDISDYEKQNNIIIIPPNPTKNEDGTWNVIKIPLSQEVNNLAGMARRPIEAAYGLDPVAVGDISRALIGAVSPIAPDKNSILSTLTPQAIKPEIEASVNRDLFTGIPIVPASMEKLSPENQFKPYTSGTARKIGGAFGISPLKLEHTIKGVFGGIGLQALNVVDNALAGAGIIPKDQIGGQNVVKAIIGRFNSARGGKSDQLDTTLSKMITEQADTKFKNQQEAEIIFNAMNQLSKEQAAAKFEELLKTRPEIAKEVSNVAQDEKLGLSYADRIIKTLGVENGNRAKYIVAELNGLKTKEEKAKLYGEYIEKKIITKQVAAQISSLLSK